METIIVYEYEPVPPYDTIIDKELDGDGDCYHYRPFVRAYLPLHHARIGNAWESYSHYDYDFLYTYTTNITLDVNNTITENIAKYDNIVKDYGYTQFTNNSHIINSPKLNINAEYYLTNISNYWNHDWCKTFLHYQEGSYNVFSPIITHNSENHIQNTHNRCIVNVANYAEKYKEYIRYKYANLGLYIPSIDGGKLDDGYINTDSYLDTNEYNDESYLIYAPEFIVFADKFKVGNMSIGTGGMDLKSPVTIDDIDLMKYLKELEARIGVLEGKVG